MTGRRPTPTATLRLLASPAPARPAEPVDRADVIDLTVLPDHRLLLGVEEAAQRLGIGRSLMYELISSGRVASVRVGRLRRISPEALSAYVAALYDRARQHPESDVGSDSRRRS